MLKLSYGINFQKYKTISVTLNKILFMQILWLDFSSENDFRRCLDRGTEAAKLCNCY